MLGPPMRSVFIVCLLALAGAARETAVESHDALGFPVILNDEVITRNDVLRSLGAKESELGSPAVLARELNALLYRKVTQLVAARLGIKVTKEEVEGTIQRQIDLRGGEAKFYEGLAQRGDTLAHYKQYVRELILQEKMGYLFINGISRDQRTLLPWAVGPRPHEIRIAYEKDPERHAAGPRVRWLEFEVKLSEAEKKPLYAMMMEGAAQKEVRAKTQALLAPHLEKVQASLAGGGAFEKLAAEQGADVGVQKERWEELASEPSERQDLRFLQQAKPGAISRPIPLPGGDGCKFLKLLERKQPVEAGPSDPNLARAYSARIRQLRARKWEALLRLRALDHATLRPERVRDGFRALLLRDLKEARQGLRTLGLH